MRTDELNPARKLSADFIRALGWACPAQIALSASGSPSRTLTPRTSSH
jgi:hypothetical protein